MALWKEPTNKEPVRDNFGRDTFGRDTSGREPGGKEPDATFDSVIEKSTLEKITPAAPAVEPIRRTGVSGASSSAKESIIASDLVIEGKIEGAGHVRIAGKFKGDVNVQGNLTIDSGAQLTGGVRADVVVVGGELSGNIEAASRVELLQTGILNGDLKAGSLTVAAGSRMRGRVEFGWGDTPAAAEIVDKRASR